MTVSVVLAVITSKRHLFLQLSVLQASDSTVINYKRQYLQQERQFSFISYKRQLYAVFVMEPAKKTQITTKRDKINVKRRAKRSSENEEQKLARLAKQRDKRSSETEEQKLARCAK